MVIILDPTIFNTMEVHMAHYVIKCYFVNEVIKFVIHNTKTKQNYIGVNKDIFIYYDDIHIDIFEWIAFLLESSQYVLSDSNSQIMMSFAYDDIITFDISCTLQKKRFLCI